MNTLYHLACLSFHHAAPGRMAREKKFLFIHKKKCKFQIKGKKKTQKKNTKKTKL